MIKEWVCRAQSINQRATILRDSKQVWLNNNNNNNNNNSNITTTTTTTAAATATTITTNIEDVLQNVNYNVTKPDALHNSHT